MLDLDDTEAGAAARLAARLEEIDTLRAIFSDEATVDGDLVRFEVYREAQPSQPGAPIESVALAFLLHEKFVVVVVVLFLFIK